MRKMLVLLATGCMALAANTASAIPVKIDILTVGVVAGGEWELQGTTNEDGYWGGIGLGYQGWEFEIEPGYYLWKISGFGWLASVNWLLTIDGVEAFSGSAGNFDLDHHFGLFNVNKDHRFTGVPTQVSEPGVLLLLGGGLLVFATVRRRKAARA